MSPSPAPRPRITPILGARNPLLPVLALEDPALAEPVLEALVASGISIIEVTLRTAQGLEIIERMARCGADIVLAAGTLTRPEHFRQVKDAGADIAVSPALTEALAEAALEAGIPFLPAVATPSEVLKARELGFFEQKLFPCTLMGGLRWLTHVAPIYPDVSFCVSGGITDDNVADFLAMPNCFAASGAYLASRTHIDARDWPALTRTSTASVAALTRAS